MTLLPLNFKKKLSRFMNWFDFGSAVMVGLLAFFSGPGGMLAYENQAGPDEAKEKAALQEKVTRLVNDYKVSQNLHMLVQAAGGPDVGVVVDLQRATARDKTLKDTFEEEERATGIALAHARQLTAGDRLDLYNQLDDIHPTPDYFRGPSKSTEGYLTFRRAQSQVMDRPDFAPTVETARDIVSRSESYGGPMLGCIFGPFLLSLGGMFGFCAARRGLCKSIGKDEKKAKEAETLRQAAEAESRAADAAEQERVSKLPTAVATATERDIRVRQIKLAAKGGAGP